MVPPPSPPAPDSRAGLWIQGIGAALTACLAVLFVVVLVRVEQQTRSLNRLEARLQSLENARALERTNILEQQLRATVQRLRTLEALQGSVADLSRRQSQLSDQLRQLSSRPPLAPDSLGPGDELLPPTVPPGRRGPAGRSPVPRPPIEPDPAFQLLR